ncbi:heparan-alpha-glucosaminide N-acetyltransferase domain-containing protein [Robiginitalea aurantiaca]|uniref:Heparan-alpha-glucosaminide N-acetyltransferase domain-containing protein n=1 Tax=Robiginitalea aurantiaca TaxID=3056915 RepID=A0ABT7WH46_9FLAO|nr:heparan-alpha-glucosaminide N-acetyltransferase domain-containing protein [Robiginitalea aurantiaca]MDM9632139.1 heparan-alpha-glucosaminide N-acetyltransferase domain-containing protein [Robiginitalea aurantiaca]
MKEQSKRLYFIDAMRAWAILMMLQGHFIDGLLDPVYRDPSNLLFSTWKYFRGITAPVFFTVSGFIFTYLLLLAPVQGKNNPRIRKGLKRGLELIGIGYLLRTNLFGLLNGVIYPSFFLVDVLHCIGIALLLLILIYLAVPKGKIGRLSVVFLTLGVLLFAFEPVYSAWDLSFMPVALANYFTRANGSVFTIIPWVGYAFIGGFMASLFYRYRNIKYLYLKSIGVFLLGGVSLIWYSSPLFDWISVRAGIALFERIALNNYLFIRLGDVMLVFAVFILLRGLMKRKVFLSIGQHTLSIYVIHFMVLYGSLTGIGLYQFWNQALTPVQVITGALIFMTFCTWAALSYNQHKQLLLTSLGQTLGWIKSKGIYLMDLGLRTCRIVWTRLIRYLTATQSR